MKNPTSFPEAHPDDLLNRLATDMVLTAYTHGADPEKDARVTKAYEAIQGQPFQAFLAPTKDHPIKASALHGPPGHGKSSVFKAAAKMAAEALGMRFVDGARLGPNEQVGPNDFLFLVKEMAGQASSVSFAGIPSKQEAEDGDHMVTLPDRAFYLANKAGASLVLLDDFGNALEHVLPSALGVIEDRRYGTHTLGEHCLVGVTTNLGKAKDGTVGTRGLGSAIVSRCSNFFVQDSLDDFIRRLEKTIARTSLAEQGDVGFVGFLRSRTDVFTSEPKMDGGPFPCPRTLERLALRMPRIVYESKADKRRGVSERIFSEAAADIGPDAAESMAAYYQMYLSGVSQLVDQAFSVPGGDKRLTQALETVSKNYGDGVSAEAQNYGRQIVFACADKVASMIFRRAQKPGTDLADLSRYTTQINARFAEFFERIHKVQAMPALTHLVSRMENQLPETFHAEDSSRLDRDLLQSIVHGFEGYLSKADTVTREEFLDALSGYDMFRDYEAPGVGA